MPSQDSSFQHVNMFIAFVDLVSNLPKREAGQLRHFRVVEAGDELLDLAAPLRRDDTEFGEMSPYGVDQHGTLAHQQIACPVQHQDGLLLFGLDRYEDHVRPHQRLDNCGSILKNASMPARRSCRRSIARPVSSTAWTWKMCLARSRPTIALAIPMAP